MDDTIGESSNTAIANLPIFPAPPNAKTLKSSPF